MSRAFALVSLLFVACVSPDPPPAARDMTPRAVVVPPPSSPEPAKPKPPITAEVEIAGKIIRPKNLKGTVRVWAENGPCFTPPSAAWGQTDANPDRWFVEVFVPQGSPIWLCAALVEGKDAWKIWGQAEHAPIMGKGTGEVTFGDITIPLKKGAAIKEPAKLYK